MNQQNIAFLIVSLHHGHRQVACKTNAQASIKRQYLFQLKLCIPWYYMRLALLSYSPIVLCVTPKIEA